MSCNDFRQTFAAGTDDPALLAHLRACDACLDFAAHADPDVLFRALGVGEMTPPGGVDAFVGDVMRAVELRGKESALAPRRGVVLAWPRKLAIAASIAVAVSAGVLTWRVERSASPVQHPMAAIHHPVAVQRALTTKPVVETYSSANATIVEVPAENASDAQVVMVIDENLPADL